MESSKSRRVEKKKYEESLDDDEVGNDIAQLKKPKLPGLASVIIEAMKVDCLQRLSSSLEPLFRRIVSEEVECALSRLGHATLTERSSPLKLHTQEGKNLQLQVRTRMPPHLFTGGKVEGDQGAAIHIVLVDMNTGNVAQTGPESSARLEVVVLEGDFNEEADKDWTKEHFESHEVQERVGKRPLLTGDLQVVLNEGVGTLGDLIFTDNSSWIRSRKFRLGVKVSPGCCDGIRIREAKTDAFAVKDHRGELYKKHYPPALHDEVWRLDRIAKDGTLHKKLINAEIITVEDFLRVLVRGPQKLRNILGNGMSNRMWENTVEHAKTCVMGGQLYVYYADGAHSTGAVFNSIYEFRGLIADGQFLSLESLNHDQKISLDSLVKRAYEDWNQVVEYDGKVLNALSLSNKGTRAFNALAADHKQTMDQHFAASQTKRNDLSIPQLIDFPFVRSEPIGTMTQNTQRLAVSGCMDYGMSAPNGAYLPGDWSRPHDGQGMEDLFSEEIRQRSTEMLESEDTQRLFKSVTMGAVGMGSSFGHSDETFHTYNIPHEHQVNQLYGQYRGRGSGKAFVGWLKLKAVLRWAIFIRKQAADRRARLVELD